MAKKTFIAGEDLTGKAGYALKAENGKVKLAGVKGEACLGILSNDNIVDKAVIVALPGEVCKVKLGGTVKMGNFLAAGTDGRLAVAQTSEHDVAMALQDGVENDKIYAVVIV